MTGAAAPRPATTIAVLGATAVASVLPAFLVGALSVQVRDELDVSTSLYGWAMSSYFLGAALTSSAIGRLAQIVGPRRQMTTALLITAAVQVVIAAAVDSFGLFLACLAACGIANAATQTAVNLAIAEAGLPRLGLAVALKQSGMPAGSMLAGPSVPLLALTVGWRWSYVAAASVGVISAALVAVVIAPSGDRRPTPTEAAAPAPLDRPPSATSALVSAAVAGGFLSFGAGTLTLWVVESGVDAGLGNGLAGLMLSLGAGLGIAIRLWWGFRLDGLTRLPFFVGGTMVFVGATGAALLAVRSSPVHVIATIVAFSGGWIWPVFTNFGIMRANRGRAAAATGITQTGVYVGILAAPLVTGVLIDRAGYGAMWLVVAASMVIGATVAVRIAHHF